MTEPPRQVGIYLRLALVAVIWGSTFIAGRVVAADMTAPTAALWRFVIATATLLVMVQVLERGLPRLSLTKWMTFVLLGAIGVAATTLAALTGTAILALWCAVTGDLKVPDAAWKPWLALVFMGVLGTAVAYLWFYDGVKVIGPARTAVFINLVPVVAITLGVLLLGETLQASMVVGASLVVTGVWIINRAPAPSSVSDPIRTG